MTPAAALQTDWTDGGWSAVLNITVNLQGSAIHLPFTKTTLDLSYAYIPLMTLLYVFMTNSANLQDGWMA